MTEIWRRLGPIAWGGSVLSVQANASGEVWAATAGGLLSRHADEWRPVSGGPAQPGLLAAPGNNWWVAALNGGLSSTYNSGRTWWEPFIDGIDEPITCIAASPRWASDRVMLAGVAGAGILRTIDGGRRWLGANFGLRDYTVLALAPATDWSRREVILAGTLDGVYRSAGGGRAWKAVGLDGLAVQALAASSGAADSGVALAGTEGAGLFRSADGGFSWQAAGDALGRDLSVNALLWHKTPAGEAFLAATDAGDLWRSEDAGLTWTRVYENADPVLALAATHDGSAVFAGTAEQGILLSYDYGMQWEPDTTLCAWGFRRLSTLGGRALLAWSPTGGVWRAKADGAGWERIASASHYEPLYAHLTIGEHALEARTETLLLRRGDDEIPVIAASDAPIIALAADQQHHAVWAADLLANLMVSRDGGMHWLPVVTPWDGQQLLQLVVADGQGGAPIVATHDAASGVITLWRRVGDDWECWLQRPARWAGAVLAPARAGDEQTWALIAGEVWAWSDPTGWAQITLPEDAGTPVALTQSGSTRCLIAGRSVLRTQQGGDWQSFLLPDNAAGPVDVMILPDGSSLLLDAVGTIWSLDG